MVQLFKTIKTIGHDQFPEDVRFSFEDWVCGREYHRGYIRWWTSGDSEDTNELVINKWLIDNGIADGEVILINWDW